MMSGHPAKLARAMVLGLLLSGLSAQAATDEPFGLATVAATDGSLPAAWRDLQLKLRSEKRIVAQCRVDPRSCASSAALRFIAIVEKGDRGEGLVRIRRINRAVNFSIGVVNARAASTAWSSPLDALAAGTGDCKQYAVLKYAALEDAGIAPDDLRIVIVGIKPPPNSNAPRTHHAVVAVRNEAHWLILDNLSLAVVESRTLLDYFEPLFTLDRRGVRQFIQPPGLESAVAPCDVAPG